MWKCQTRHHTSASPVLGDRDRMMTGTCWWDTSVRSRFREEACLILMYTYLYMHPTPICAHTQKQYYRIVWQHGEIQAVDEAKENHLVIKLSGKDISMILEENQISMTLVSHLSDTVTNTWDHQLIKKQGLFQFSPWKLLSMANVSCYLGPRIRIHGRARPISSWRGNEREEEDSRVPQSPSSVHPPWQKYFLLGHTL